MEQHQALAKNGQLILSAILSLLAWTHLEFVLVKMATNVCGQIMEIKELTALAMIPVRQILLFSPMILVMLIIVCLSSLHKIVDMIQPAIHQLVLPLADALMAQIVFGMMAYLSIAPALALTQVLVIIKPLSSKSVLIALLLTSAQLKESFIAKMALEHANVMMEVYALGDLPTMSTVLVHNNSLKAHYL